VLGAVSSGQYAKPLAAPDATVGGNEGTCCTTATVDVSITKETYPFKLRGQANRLGEREKHGSGVFSLYVPIPTKSK
jgi:hypothetical protein